MDKTGPNRLLPQGTEEGIPKGRSLEVEGLQVLELSEAVSRILRAKSVGVRQIKPLQQGAVLDQQSDVIMRHSAA